MDKRFLHPRDRNDRVKLGLVREYSAASARAVADAKEKKLRDGVEPFIARGYRVEELALVEKAHPSLNPMLDKIEIGIVKPRFPFTLWKRRMFRRVWPYRYSIQADRAGSRVADGQS